MNKLSEKKLRARITADLRAAFPTQINFDRTTAAQIVGVSRGYLSNRELEGKPLLPLVRIGRKPLVQFSDIIDFLVGQRLQAQNRRGPKAKAEKLGAQEGVEA